MTISPEAINKAKAMLSELEQMGWITIKPLAREQAVAKLAGAVIDHSGAISDRDKDWILAMAQAVGSESGIKIPIVPTPLEFQRFVQAIQFKTPQMETILDQAMAAWLALGTLLALTGKKVQP